MESHETRLAQVPSQANSAIIVGAATAAIVTALLTVIHDFFPRGILPAPLYLSLVSCFLATGAIVLALVEHRFRSLAVGALVLAGAALVSTLLFSSQDETTPDSTASSEAPLSPHTKTTGVQAGTVTAQTSPPPATRTMPVTPSPFISTPEVVPSPTATPFPPTRRSTLAANGAFGFPQQTATTLLDSPEMKVSVASNAQWLLVQAIFWSDSSPSPAPQSAREAKPTDTSVLALDLDSNGKETPHLDRNYLINPWDIMPGLYFTESRGGRATSELSKQTKAVGGIHWTSDSDGKLVRLDTYAIPLSEISKKPNDHVRLGFYLKSEVPKRIATMPSIRNAPRLVYPYHMLYEDFVPYQILATDNLQEVRLPPSIQTTSTLQR